MIKREFLQKAGTLALAGMVVFSPVATSGVDTSPQTAASPRAVVLQHISVSMSDGLPTA